MRNIRKKNNKDLGDFLIYTFLGVWKILQRIIPANPEIHIDRDPPSTV
jgi:hypothetical protein